ncbi:HNH endonuclease signature motif containing protein [Miniimonas sp. S16]|uniref:HNH endonuclease signature motif containing protein n=1 Tax=Miniimonas sp. S16 TaxID=2171623 RepID=UPI00131EE11A|nr:HNH endonuclease signature motif containing protein [Miniimonas sp. S16]
MAQLLDGTLIRFTALEVLACDAYWQRLVLNPEGQPVNIGRSERTYTGDLRRAVLVRDRHCQWPGCTLRATWCQVHHVQHWAHGGETNIANAITMCSRHHHDIHRDDIHITTTPGGFVFTTARGDQIGATTRLEDHLLTPPRPRHTPPDGTALPTDEPPFDGAALPTGETLFDDATSETAKREASERTLPTLSARPDGAALPTGETLFDGATSETTPPTASGRTLPTLSARPDGAALPAGETLFDGPTSETAVRKASERTLPNGETLLDDATSETAAPTAPGGTLPTRPAPSHGAAAPTRIARPDDAAPHPNRSTRSRSSDDTVHSTDPPEPDDFQFPEGCPARDW